MRLRTVILAVCLLLATIVGASPAIFGASPASAAPPSDFRTTVVVDSGLDEPSGFDIAPDGRVFILERTGKVKIYKNGRLLAQPFADLPTVPTGDRGLIGIAFDPGFGVANHHVYFYYTGQDLLNHVVRFDASGDVGTNGPLQIFATTSPSQLLHVGGTVAFGPDGKLYFSVGDNGLSTNAQDLANPHGKILRVNPDGSIPSDNPFAGRPGKDGAIWAYGLRNPYRFAFDRSTGQLYAGDVGDASWEELNRIVKGGNYGWPLAEGRCTADCAGLTDPIYTYPHSGQSAAITGGPVYRGTQFPAAYRGRIFIGDYAQGFIRSLTLDANGAVTSATDFDATAGTVVDLKVGPDGSLYYLDYFPGRLNRIDYTLGSHLPIAQASAAPTKGKAPLKVLFSAAGSRSPDGKPLTYHWTLGDGYTSYLPTPKHVYSKPGVYTARLTVSDGTLSAQATPVVIQVGMPPTVTISSPVDGTLYRAGDTFTYNAAATDAAGLDLNDAAISTEVRFHHGTHFHPFAGPLIGRAGTFTIPTTGEPSADTWYEIRVTATDRHGLATTKSVNVYPRKSTFTLATTPAGLGLRLDGIPVATPLAVQGVVGFQRQLSAPPTTTAADGTVYHFTGWSDGGAIVHTVTTADTDRQYTAAYARSAPFTGEYFGNLTLSGTPVVTRSDPRIDFFWDQGAPAVGVPADGFSVRWTKSEFFSAGKYQFTTVTDDGVRLFVDGRAVIDEWHDQSSVTHQATVDLASGTHTIRMEYYDSGWTAQADLGWDTAS